MRSVRGRVRSGVVGCGQGVVVVRCGRGLACGRWAGSPVELDGQAQVGDAAGAVLLHQDVLALEVAVGDGGLALRAVDLGVEVAEAARHRVGQPQQAGGVQAAHAQEVVQRALLVVVRDQEELCQRARALDVRRDEA